MKKTLKILIVLLIIFVCIFAFVACDNGDNSVPKNPSDSGTTTPSDPGNTTPSNPGTATPSDMSAEQVVTAIKTQSQSTTQNYDFRLQLSGNVQVGGLATPNANAIYDGSYRFNSATNELKFKRTTSGILLYDSTEYIQSQGDSIITIKQNDKGKIKKVSVEARGDLDLINAPFVSLVSSLEASNITNITPNGTSGYTANLQLSADNKILNLICIALGKMDLNLSLKGVTFTNPVNGLDFEFTMSNGFITSYTLTAKVTVPVKSANVDLDLKYEQRYNSEEITLPSYNQLITGKTEISTVVSNIASKLVAIKSDDSYSLDVKAVNEMDPAWNVFATTDSFQSRFYKNPTAFNNSYEYKVHNVADKSETYKYSIGNIADNTVWKVKHLTLSKEGQELSSPVTANDQFDSLTSIFNLNASNISCITSETKNSETTYTIYLTDTAVKALSDSIVELINTNNEEGVIKVNNFIGSDFTVKEASFTVVITNDKLTSIDFETEIRYTPTSGEYIEYNVTLNNELTLEINKRLADAEKYKAPKNADGTISHLDYLL